MKILSLDIGLKRVGIAYSPTSSIVVPLEAVIRKNREQASSDVKKVLDEYGIEILIIGVPVGGSSEDEMRRRVEHFSKLLNFSGEIYFQDESFSSFEAKEMTKGVFRHKKDGKLDSISAKLILQRWLDENGKKI
ncbi:MAG: Holliday junction resolvase RuvX [Campylobacterales bacterium]|nr:Holliday junction resolvase RuvX [Campylobacterales bacterium]